MKKIAQFATVTLTLPILTMMVLFPQTRAALAAGITGKAEAGDIDQRAAEKYGPALKAAAQVNGSDLSPVADPKKVDLSPVVTLPASVFPTVPESYPVQTAHLTLDTYTVKANDDAKGAGIIPTQVYHDGVATIVELSAAVRDNPPAVWKVIDGQRATVDWFYPKAQQPADAARLVIMSAGGTYVLRRGTGEVEIAPRQ